MTEPPMVVEPSWLMAGNADPGLVIADVRWVPGGSVPEAFAAGHLPGAICLDLERDLARPAFDGPGRHPLPSAGSFARTMEAAGIGDDTAVVVYDDVGGWVAARLWWMLSVTGHRAALLDLPTLDAWVSAGGSFEIGAPSPREAASFTVSPWPADRVVDAEQVRNELARGETVVLDARSWERYRGEIEPIDPVAGHVPGSISAPWTGNRGAAADGPLLSSAALKARYEALGVRRGPDAIALCGSGVTAAFAVFAMERAGLPGARLYEGSWSDWTHDPTRPVATGAEPGRMPPIEPG